MLKRTHFSFIAVASICLAIVACQSDDSPTSLGEIGIAADVLPGGGAPDGDGAADLEEFELCKFGTTTTFDFSVFEVATSTTTSGQVTLDDGDCVVIALSGGVGANVTVTETEPAGWDLDHVDVTTNNNGAFSTVTVSGPTVSGTVSGSAGAPGLQGILAEYFNIPEPPGGEGCTPGFWKNHLSAWGPSGLSPSDDFDTTFGVDLFNPDITLNDAIRLGGGGVRKLARHGTAALINAAHPGVSYPLSVAGVIAAVQAGDADTLAGFNELGCDVDD